MQSVTLGTGKTFVVAASIFSWWACQLAIPSDRRVETSVNQYWASMKSTVSQRHLGKAVGLAGLVAALTLAADVRVVGSGVWCCCEGWTN